MKSENKLKNEIILPNNNLYCTKCKLCGSNFHHRRKICLYAEFIICDKYVNGKSTYKIAEEYDLNPKTISNILHKNKIQLRSKSEAKGGLPLHLEPIICKKYKNGESTLQLAKQYGVHNVTIRQILIRNNQPLRNYSASQKGKVRIKERRFSPKIELSICKEYADGKSTTTLAKKYNSSNSLINMILSRNNIKKRTISEAMMGENSPNWLGGISFEPYCTKFNKEFKERVRTFWDNKCSICGKTEKENGPKLAVHHVTYDKKACCNDKIAMFVTLCTSCHGKTNFNRNYWENMLFTYINLYYNGHSFINQESVVYYDK
jgi:Mor family transcriptional regulator